MSKKRKKQPQPRRAEPKGEAILFEREEWSDAEARLALMEEGARRALRNPGGMNIRIVVPTAPPPKPPVLLPARFGNVLYGPDGKLLKEI